MAMAIVADRPGGPEVLNWREVETGSPEPTEVVIRQSHIGLNFTDIYRTTGLYAFPKKGGLVPGSEAAGTVIAVGSSVSEFTVGDRVGYVSPDGAYCEERTISADYVVKLPDQISNEVAAASMLKGMTVEYLLNRSANLKAGNRVLFHAAAGGVGQIAGQWLRYLGVEAIGTASNADKVEKALKTGYNQVINYAERDFVEEVRKITNGEGVDVVFDSVGKDTYPHSLRCLKQFGLFVSFGNSSGAITNMKMSDLASNGSLYVQRPSLFNYISDRSRLLEMSSNLFEMLGSGHLNLDINQRYELEDVATAFEDLQSRKTTGATVLTV